MKIDLTKLVTNQVEEILIDEEVKIDSSWFQTTTIRDLKEVRFQGEVSKLYDGGYQISGSCNRTVRCESTDGKQKS